MRGAGTKKPRREPRHFDLIESANRVERVSCHFRSPSGERPGTRREANEAGKTQDWFGFGVDLRFGLHDRGGFHGLFLAVISVDGRNSPVHLRSIQRRNCLLYCRSSRRIVVASDCVKNRIAYGKGKVIGYFLPFRSAASSLKSLVSLSVSLSGSWATSLTYSSP